MSGAGPDDRAQGTAAPRPLVFTDLDDTLFASRRKQPQGALQRVTTATNGHHSYMSPAQEGLFAWLMATAEVIPVTARSSEAFARVHLPFAGPAVLSMGAVIRHGGALDPEWHARLERIAADEGARLHEMRGALAAQGPGLRHWIVEEEGLPVYLCAKANAEAPAAVTEALAAAAGRLAGLAEEAVAIHVNGNNLSAVPRAISKRAAVAHLAETLGAGRPLIGIGDSISDLPFMEMCHMMMMPAGSQIHRAQQAGTGREVAER